MDSRILKMCWALVGVLLLLQSACLASAESGSNKIVSISSLEANTVNVYPRGNSEIKCIVSAPGGDTLQYTWSTDGGTITGDGSTVYWEGPADYGDYHVMVTAKDGTGASDQAAITVHVIPRPIRSCCGRRF